MKSYLKEWNGIKIYLFDLIDLVLRTRTSSIVLGHCKVLRCKCYCVKANPLLFHLSIGLPNGDLSCFATFLLNL